MNALMVGGELGSANGVVGYNFGETRLPPTNSAAEFDERGVRIKSVDPAAATQGLKPKGMQGDPGEAYRAVSAKLEEKRQAAVGMGFLQQTASVLFDRENPRSEGSSAASRQELEYRHNE
jgi:hypothetical protein